MTVTKAYVLSDGEVVSKGYLDAFAFKQDSKAMPVDKFNESHYEKGLVQPLYTLEALAELLEMNTYHYRAVKTKARDTAGLGWYLEPKDIPKPSEEQKAKAEEFLENPNASKTLTEILDMVMVDHEATGNGYMEIIRNDQGEIAALEHIPSHTMRVHKDMNKFAQVRGNKKVWFKKFGLDKDVDIRTGEYVELNALNEELRGNEIIHIKNYTSRSDYYGVPDIMPSLGALLGDIQRQEYNTSFFDNHAIPAYAVTVTGADLDEDTERAIKRFFQHDVKGNAHSTLVLTAKKDENDYNAEPVKFEFHALSVETKEASFRMFRQDNRDEILSAHGVPPYRAGITVEGQLGGSTAEESTEIYKQSIVRPKQELLENVINRFVLREGLEITDWNFRFNQIDTRDLDKEIDRLEKLFHMGAYSPNMILEELGKERIEDPNMDRHFVNGMPINLSNEESQAIVRSMKELHEKMIQIVTKGSYQNE